MSEAFAISLAPSGFESLLALDQSILDAIPVALCVYAPGGLVKRCNRRAVALLGDAASPSLEAVLGAGQPERDKELVIRRPDGGRIILLANIEPLLGAGGAVEGAVGCFEDITDRKPAVSAEDALGQLAAIVESSDDAIVSKRLDGTIISWNKSAERLFGYTAEEVVGKPVNILIPADRQDEEPLILERVRRGERIDHYETVRRCKDGRLLDLSLTISPVKDAQGRIVGASKIARDITERKRADAQRELLLAELSHRVKNTLATVISIAHQSSRARAADEAWRSFEARIFALAHTHTHLARTHWTGVPLERILQDELAPYESGESAVRLSGPPITLNAKSALSLSLAIHELTTNAAKYGALSAKSGRVAVDWTVQPARNALQMSWVERGGPAVSPPLHSGFGRLLLERVLASDLDGAVTLDFAPDGLECRISFPLGPAVLT